MKKQLNVRIPEELYNKLADDSRPTVDVITELLENYYSNDSSEASNDSNADSTNDIIRSLETEVDQAKAINLIKDERIKDLQIQLGWLQNEYSRLNTKLLYPGRPWWKFWQK